MKRLKITSVILSVAMLCSMMMPSIVVMADETSVPSETKATETAEKKEPEETKKPETKETSKPKETEVPKETKAVKETEAPKETEAVKETEAPKETAEPKETEAAKETEAPKEIEKPAETIKETEKPAAETPKETEKPSAETPTETEPKETEDSKETEVPEESDTAKETEQPKETAGETTPAESVPEESVKKSPKDVTVNYKIQNAQISNKGILTWTPNEGVKYELWVDGEWLADWNEETPASFDLKKEIDNGITKGKLDNSNPHEIMLAACDEDWAHMDEWTGTFTYTSTATPIDFEIKNAKISNNGILTWTPNEGVKYELWVDGEWLADWNEETPASFDLKKEIDNGITKGKLDNSNPHEIMLAACDEDWAHMDEWTGTFTYTSTATPIDFKIKNAKISSDGILTWTQTEGVKYGLRVEGEELRAWEDETPASVDLKKEIDIGIKKGILNNADSYEVALVAYNEDWDAMYEWTRTFTYTSSATPVDVGEITNVTLSNGILTWDSVSGAAAYGIEIVGEVTEGDLTTNSYNLGNEIDRLIKEGLLSKSNSYKFRIIAFDGDNVRIAEWYGSKEYSSNAEPIVKGTISGVTINNGVMTWSPYAGADGYNVIVDDWYFWVSETSFNLNEKIDYCIKNEYIEKGSPYAIRIEAYDSDEVVLADWSDNYTYDSTAEPIERGTVNAAITNGILTWDAYEGAADYSVWIDDQEVTATSRSVDLNKAIADMIKSGTIESSSTYLIEIYAYDDEGDWIASWSKEYSYSQPTQTSISSATVTGITNKTYTGGEVKQTITVTVNGTNLKEDTDYTVAYSDNVNAGTAKITITGKGNYTGTIEKTFTISPVGINATTVSGIVDKTYTGEEILQTFSVSLNGTVLKVDTDYTVGYANIINVGTAKVTITGKGNYTGTIEKTFKINAYDIADASVTGVEDRYYCGGEVKLALVVTAGTRYLSEVSDYTVSYSDNIKVGTAKLTITGKGNYAGQIEKTFKIKTIDIGNSHVSGYDDKPYTGSEVTVPLVLTLNGNKLEEGVDYTLSYANNVEVGTATITITGIGNCNGSFSVSFKITQAQNTLSVQSGKKKISYKKLRKKAQTISLPKVAKVSNAQGTLKYSVISAKKSKSKKSFKSKFKVNASTGVITIKKKKLKKGTYTVTCSVTASGNDQYAGITRAFTVTVKVK